ncbi:MAG: Gfo/Idh/MocA family oxidoreductase [Rhodospirillaceae bacterium]|jgi:predicted dehydrogenase
MINALIVGLGGWGQKLVNSVEGKSDKIKFTYGLTRSSSDEAKAFAKEKGFELLTCSYEEAVARDEIDAVVLATPHSAHADQIVVAAAAGKSIACDKPFTLNKADADRAIQAAQDADVPLVVLHNRRFQPAYQELQRMVKEGELGDICHIEANFSTDSGIKRRIDPRKWRDDPNESPLGSMTNRGVHAMDAMIGCCGPVDKVFTAAYNLTDHIRGIDTAQCMLWFKSGITGHLGTFNITASYWRLKAYGTKATAEMRTELELAVQKVGGKIEVKKFDKVDIERAELEAFADMLSGGKPYPMTYEEMAAVPAFLETAVKSHETGQPEQTP